MTAGQLAAPYRQIRTSLLVAALAIAFGLGLLIGLVGQRGATTGGQAATTVGEPAAMAGGNARAGAPVGVSSDGQNFRGAQDFRAATGGSSVGVSPALDPKLDLNVQGGVVVPGAMSAAAAVDAGAHNLRGTHDFRAAAGSTFAVTPVLDPKPYLTIQSGVVVPPSSSVAAPALDPAHLSTSGTGWSRGVHPL